MADISSGIKEEGVLADIGREVGLSLLLWEGKKGVIMGTAPPKKKILVVEDDPDVRAYLSKALGHDGFDVCAVSDGEEAVKVSGEVAPDLILMDVQLPGIDGYQATTRIKKQPRQKDTPVIFLSGRSAAEDGGRSFEVGGSMYLRKPIRINQLRDILGLVFGPPVGGTAPRKEIEA